MNAAFSGGVFSKWLVEGVAFFRGRHSLEGGVYQRAAFIRGNAILRTFSGDKNGMSDNVKCIEVSTVYS